MALAKRQRGKCPWKWNKSKSMDQSENLRWNKYTLFLTSLICIGQAQCGGDKTYEKRKSRQTETSHLRSAHPCVSLHFASVAQSSLTLCDPMDCSTPGFPVYHQLLEPAQTHVHWVSDAIQPSYLCHPLLLPSIFPSIRVFSNESVLRIRWPENWSFSFSTSPSNEYSGLTSFRIDWLDHLEVQGTLKSFLQHHSWKTSILRCSAFFMVQLSHPYMTTGKPQLLLDGPSSVK